jgi:hypothetical protein
MKLTDTARTFLTRIKRSDERLRMLDMVTLPHKRSAPEMASRTVATSKGLELQARLQLLICLSMLYTTLLFSTLAFPAGAKQVPVSFVTGLLHFGFLAVLTRCAFDPFRLLAVGAALSVIYLESALFHSDFSPLSLIYVTGTYLPLALTLPLLDANAIRTIWKHVSILGMVAAVCGFIQLAGQFILQGAFLDPIRLLPESLLLQNFNTTYPIYYGASLLKPNGMFLLEPSFFSQLVAMALVSEFVFFHRKWRIVFLMAALTFSFSGTGILMLVPALLFVGSTRMIFMFAFFAIVMAATVVGLGVGDVFVNRATETSEAGSSGNERFVAPFEEMVQQWTDTTATICLFGAGAGSSERKPSNLQFSVTPVTKVGMEYGVVGLSAFILLWFSWYYNLALPRAMTVMLFILYFLASGSFLQAFVVFSIWALSAGFMRKTAPNETAIRTAFKSRASPEGGQTPLPFSHLRSVR